MVRLAAIGGVLAALAASAAADPRPTSRCDEVTTTLARDADRARRWNLAWGITFGAAAIGSAGAALAIPDGRIDEDTRAGMWISAGKAAIGALSRLVLPLRIDQPTGCADVERALAVSARRERNGFWLNTAGGLVLNTAGLLYLGLERDAWGTAALSFAVGTAVGLFSSYTAPRRAWRLRRVALVPTVGGLAITGAW